MQLMLMWSRAGAAWKRAWLGLGLVLTLGLAAAAAKRVTIAVTGDIYKPDAKVVSDAESKGVQEFVIGPGGATPVKAEDPAAKGPASALFHGGAQHIGFFVLHPDGAFAYTVKSVSSQGQRAP